MTNFRLLRQEVNELTDLLRNDKNWTDLRKVITDKGLSVDRVFLGGFMEDEEGHDYGVIVTDKLKVIEFQRDMSRKKGSITKWQAAKRVDRLAEEFFPAVKAAIEIAREMYQDQSAPGASKKRSSRSQHSAPPADQLPPRSEGRKARGPRKTPKRAASPFCLRANPWGGVA